MRSWAAPFPPGISSAMTLTMEAVTKGKTYKIGQAAKLLDVKPFVLRFWEGEFKDVLVPVRTPSGQRAYTEGNVELVREIKRLLYDEGLTIEGAKKRLREAKDQPGGQPPPHVPLAPATPAQPGHSPELQHFESQPPLPGLARPEATEAAHATQHAAQLAAQAAAQAAAQHAALVAADAEAQAARQQAARAEESSARADARADEATARADEAATLADAATARAEVATARAAALTQALTHFRQELLAIRDLLG